MPKSNFSTALLSLALDRRAQQPLHTQLASEIRQLVHAGRLTSGDRLPPSRGLATELSVSRVTVTTAYDQLTGEGYLCGRPGAGIFVAPDLATLPRPPVAATAPDSLPTPDPLRPFDSAAPDHAHFPHRQWARLMDLTWRTPAPALLARPDPLGWAPLREAIARHLKDWRGIACEPSRVVVTCGLSEAVGLIAETMLSPGDRLAVEDPGHPPLRAIATANGLTCTPLPVDGDGLDAATLPPGTHAVAVTPSRQFPLGMTLPLARRLQLLHWATETGGLIIEDDFDGEYRYQGQPLPAMTALDAEGGRVIYVGSFSKVMFPGLRLGFMVVPAAQTTAIARALARTGARAAIVAQPVLARFMAEGHFATHLRRMRRLYAQRGAAIATALQHHCADLLEPGDVTGGMHMAAALAPPLAARMSDRQVTEHAAAAGISARPLSAHFAGPTTRQGLILGFAAFDEKAIATAAERLARALRVT